MANEFAHTHTDDPCKLATAGDIVLVSASGGIRRDFVEMLSEKGIYIPDAAVKTKPVEEFQIEYELRDSTLTIPLGAYINSAYLMTALNVQSASDKYPTVSLTVVKFSATDKLLTASSAGTLSASSIDIAGGFGLVNKFGATITRGISSTLSVSMQAAERLEETSGDYLAAGYVQYGFKQELSFESYSAIGSGETITGIADANVTSRDKKTGRDGWETHAASCFVYMA